MNDDEPPELSRCHEHGVQLAQDSDGRINYCPACELDLESRPEDDVPGKTEATSVRSPIRKETLEELVPLMREYLEDRQGEDYDLWISHDRFEGKLPAGYSEQERFVPVLRYVFGNRTKGIDHDPSAQETIETLKENGYGDE